MTLAKIFFVACMTALGWLYTFMFSQYFLYQGGRAGGHDMGVVALVSGWTLAIVWGKLGMRTIASAVVRTKSTVGYLLIAIFSLPIGIFIGGTVQEGLLSGKRTFSTLFSYLTLGNRIEDGRHGMREFYTGIFLAIMALGIFGLIISCLLEDRARKWSDLGCSGKR